MGSQLSMRTTIQLNNGRDMPVLGLGVARMAEGAETEQSVLWALEAGYRLIDTAKIYGNEASVGQCRQEKRHRQGRDLRHDQIVAQRLFRVKAALQKPRQAGACLHRSLLDPLAHTSGEKRHMEGLLKNLRGRPGSVHRRQQLQCQAISSVGRGSRHPRLSIKCCFIPFPTRRSCSITASQRILLLKPTARWPGAGKLNDPVIAEIAGKYAKAPAQIMIRWSLQHGLIPIPKSSNKKDFREYQGFRFSHRKR